MVETTCECGAAFTAPETRVGQALLCEACGQPIHLVAGEVLPDGAGTGDFDAHLVIDSGPSRVGEQIFIGGVPDITIGKLPDKHIVLAGGTRVSRCHCFLSRIDFGPSRWEVRDNHSTNGVLVNGERVEKRELQNNDLLTVGDYDLRFICTFERDNRPVLTAGPTTATAAVAATAPVAQVLGYSTQPAAQRLIEDSDPRWVTNLANATSFMVWAVAINFLSSCIPREQGLKMFIDFSMALLSFFAAWLITSPEPGAPSSSWDMLRLALRVLASVKVVGELTIGAGIAMHSQPIRMTGGIIALAFVPQLFLFLLYMYHLAMRIPDRGLAINCLVVMIGLPCSVAAVFVAAVFVGITRPVAGLGSGHLQAAAFFALLGVGGLLVFSLWYVGLLIWLKHRFSD